MAAADPYAVLGVAPDASDEAVRRRYLELIREFPPEQHPETFARVRQAYERLRDLKARVHDRLFEHGKGDSLDQLAADLGEVLPRPRPSLRQLLEGGRG